MNSNETFCDHPCPLHETCARYLEGLERANTNHIDPIPYKNGKCGYFTPLTEDDIIEKIQAFLKPFNN